jgi:hypothetical protein
LANSFYLDASSLAKRYVPETGSPQVHAILDHVPGERLYVLNVGAGEVISILVRKRNAGVISDVYFAQAVRDVETEIVHAAHVHRVSVAHRLAIASFPLIVAHSINSTDAIMLSQRSSSPGGCAPRAMTWSSSPPISASYVPRRPKGWSRSTQKARTWRRWQHSSAPSERAGVGEGSLLSTRGS